MQKKLEVINLTKTFSGVEAVNNVSFDVFDGEFLSILGPSGCGKTTILRMLIGLLSQDKGVILKDGIDISKLPSSKRGMGIVFQNYALFQNMNVMQNVEYALRFNADTKQNSRQIAIDIIEQVGLTEHINKKPAKLSGGQQQRVAIARTLALNPDIVLFDEPMAALDVSVRLILREEIKKIQAQFNTTMIYITHDQEEAFAMSDRVMVMEKGIIQQIDTPINIVNNPANEYIEKFVVENLKLKANSLLRFVGGSANT